MGWSEFCWNRERCSADTSRRKGFAVCWTSTCAGGVTIRSCSGCCWYSSSGTVTFWKHSGPYGRFPRVLAHKPLPAIAEFPSDQEKWHSDRLARGQSRASASRCGRPPTSSFPDDQHARHRRERAPVCDHGEGAGPKQVFGHHRMPEAGGFVSGGGRRRERVSGGRQLVWIAVFSFAAGTGALPAAKRSGGRAVGRLLLQADEVP